MTSLMTSNANCMMTSSSCYRRQQQTAAMMNTENAIFAAYNSFPTTTTNPNCQQQQQQLATNNQTTTTHQQQQQQRFNQMFPRPKQTFINTSRVRLVGCHGNRQFVDVCCCLETTREVPFLNRSSFPTRPAPS